MNLRGVISGRVCVLARGEAEGFDRARLDPRGVAIVRYADPAAWSVACAIARALTPCAAQVTSERDRVAVVTCSPRGPAETIARVAQDVRQGYPSPMRYPAANPGSLAGVACILFGFRGPTLTLLSDLSGAVPAALFLAGRWMEKHSARYALAAAPDPRGAPGLCRARALLLGDTGEGDSAAEPLEESMAWLGFGEAALP